MERTFTRAAGSHLQPVEIGKRLVRTMDAHQSIGMDGVLVPNVYDVYLSARDYADMEPARGSLSREFANRLGREARQRRFHMVSRPVVQLRRDAALQPGDVRVEPHMQDVEPERDNFQHTSVLPPADSLAAPQATRPGLVLDGRTYAVLRSPTQIGRQADNDIVLDDKRVSRHHAEIQEKGGRWLLRDMGSTNGTAVNGKIVKEAALKPGDQVSLGGLECTWEQ